MKNLKIYGMNLAKSFLKSGTINFCPKYFSSVCVRDASMSMFMSINNSLIINPMGNNSVDKENDLVENLNLDELNKNYNTNISNIEEDDVSVDMKGRNSKAPKRVSQF